VAVGDRPGFEPAALHALVHEQHADARSVDSGVAAEHVLGSDDPRGVPAVRRRRLAHTRSFVVVE